MYSPLRIIKPNHKIHAGGYWRKIHYSDSSKIDGIKMTDTEGLWVKVSYEEATYDSQIQQSQSENTTTEKAKLGIELNPQPQSDLKKRIPIWAKLYPPDLKQD